MIYTKELKNITYTWDSDKKEFTILRRGNEMAVQVPLNRSEAGALQRFIFSMFQFHSARTKVSKKKETKTKQVEEQSPQGALL